MEKSLLKKGVMTAINPTISTKGHSERSKIAVIYAIIVSGSKPYCVKALYLFITSLKNLESTFPHSVHLAIRRTMSTKVISDQDVINATM